jgi:protein-L-isoaspartate(D-aspartate) O-methyltransferase
MADSISNARDPFTVVRQRMVKDQIERRGVKDRRVLRAMEAVPRHLFVPEEFRDRAYDDSPLPIGEGQTISQPYIVAFMTEAIRPAPRDRVLEVGTGSGYQAAVLAGLVSEVFTIEIRPDLAQSARDRLADLGYGNVTVKAGDGFRGWPEHAPYDAIIVTAAPQDVPAPLIEQLKPGGLLVIPIGPRDSDLQQLVRLTRTAAGTTRETLLPVRFVPMTGEARRPD